MSTSQSPGDEKNLLKKLKIKAVGKLDKIRALGNSEANMTLSDELEKKAKLYRDNSALVVAAVDGFYAVLEPYHSLYKHEGNPTVMLSKALKDFRGHLQKDKRTDEAQKIMQVEMILKRMDKMQQDRTTLASKFHMSVMHKVYNEDHETFVAKYNRMLRKLDEMNAARETVKAQNTMQALMNAGNDYEKAVGVFDHAAGEVMQYGEDVPELLKACDAEMWTFFEDSAHYHQMLVKLLNPLG